MANNHVITNYDTSKIFLGNIRTRKESYKNLTGSTATVAVGTLMARILSGSDAGKVVPHGKAATNGSQFAIVGVLMNDLTSIANNGTADAIIVYGGEIPAAKITLAASNALTDIVSTQYTDSATNTITTYYGTIQDLIISRTQLVLVGGIELSSYDNQPA